jgi:RHS repeat-associated protein
VHFAGERIAESPTVLPEGGFPELPAEPLTTTPPPPRGAAVLVLLALLLALAVRLVPRGLRAMIPAAASLVLAALSCHHDATRTLTPDEHTRFHVADRLGSASLVLDHRGRVLTRDAADPYGAPRHTWRASDDTAAPTYRFTGKEDDALSGAVAIGARHYLPQLGRWTSPDPHYLQGDPGAALTTPGEANPYSYVAGNPVNTTDPTGHKGLAHGSENRPSVLDNFPDSPNAGFKGRMAAVEHNRAVTQYRNAQLTVMAVTVTIAAITVVDWALTASDILDTAALASGPGGWAAKGGKFTVQGRRSPPQVLAAQPRRRGHAVALVGDDRPALRGGQVGTRPSQRATRRQDSPRDRHPIRRRRPAGFLERLDQGSQDRLRWSRPSRTKEGQGRRKQGSRPRLPTRGLRLASRRRRQDAARTKLRAWEDGP